MIRSASNLRFICILAALFAMGSWAMALTDVRQGGFELEGNIADDALDGSVDWVNLNCTDPDTPGPFTTVRTGAIHPLPGQNRYTQGSKDILDWPSNAWDSASSPSKGDIVNGYAAQLVLPSGEKLIYLGGDRLATQGTTFIGAWFFQNPVCADPLTHTFTAPGPDGACGTADDPPAARTIGDVLILANFEKGGRQSFPAVFEWVDNRPDCCASGASGCPSPLPPTGLGGILQKGDTLCDITPAPGGGAIFAEGFSNAADQVIPATCDDNINAATNLEIDPTPDFATGEYDDWLYNAKAHGVPDGTIPVNGFFEVGINFTALGLSSECFSTFLLETRSSSDVDAELKDFIVHSFAPCSVKCEKTISPHAQCDGAGPIQYSYSVINGPVGLTLTACDDNGTATTSDDFCITGSDGSGRCTTVSGDCSSSPVACRRNYGADEIVNCKLVAGDGGPIKSVSVGTHTNILTVKDVSGQATSGTCSDTVTVNANPVVTIAALACNAGTNGATSFDLNSVFTTAGTPPYTCTWDRNGTPVSTTTNAADCDLTGQSVGGKYNLSVTDSKTCTANTSIPIGYCSSCP